MKIGDVVRLKSGGPKMTVEKIHHCEGYLGVPTQAMVNEHMTTASILCVWFHDSGMRSKHFPLGTLEAAGEEDEEMSQSPVGEPAYVEGYADGISRVIKVVHRMQDNVGADSVMAKALQGVIDNITPHASAVDNP